MISSKRTRADSPKTNFENKICTNVFNVNTIESSLEANYFNDIFFDSNGFTLVYEILMNRKQGFDFFSLSYFYSLIKKDTSNIKRKILKSTFDLDNFSL